MLKLPLRKTLNTIFCLSHKHGFCYAGLEFIADQEQCTIGTIRRHINKLVDMGVICRYAHPGLAVQYHILPDSPVVKELRSSPSFKLHKMPYKKYLQTDHWQSLRKEALSAAKYRCQLCNAEGLLDVHHRTYERRGFEDMEDLTVLCRSCHSKHHDKYDDRPVDSAE
jgi:hypothetical protein